MYVLVTYRDEENQIKLKELQWSQHWKSFLPTNEEDPFINKGARVVTTDLPLYVYADFL